MVYAKQEIEAIAAKTRFIKSNVEKVVRLIDILSYIHTTSPETGEFALKGGTAIHLCILDIPNNASYFWICTIPESTIKCSTTCSIQVNQSEPLMRPKSIVRTSRMTIRASQKIRMAR